MNYSIGWSGKLFHISKLKLVSLAILIVLVCIFSLRGVFADTVTLTGSVEDSSGNPIVGAIVSVNDANSDSTTTDSSGNYSMTVSTGDFNVEVTSPSGSGYSSLVDNGENVSANTTLNFVLTPSTTSSFSGYIYDESGNPAKDQTVYISTPSSTIDTTTTNSSGYYSTSVAPGTYKVDISNSSDYNDLSQNLPGSYDIAFSNYSLTQDTIQNFTLPVREVSVHIQDANNNPVSGVALTATSSGISNLSVDGLTANGNDGYGTSTGAVPTTDANGNATLWLFPSTYTITATPPSGSSYILTTDSNVSVTSDTSETITLQQPVTFSGYIYDESGNPAKDQTVYISTPSSTIDTTTTNSSGYYSTSVAPGTYKVDISNSSDYNDLSQNLPGSYDIAFSNYSLTQDTIQNFTLPVREVSVHIQDANNNPVSGVALTATSSGISNLSVDGLTANGNDGYGTSTGAVPTTDANGNATLWLFPSTYTITATPPSGSSYILTTDSNVSVTSDTSETITLQQPVTFSGYIYDESGNPAKDQTVYISTPSSTIDTTTTNSSGYYSTSVAPGTYKVDISNSSDYNDLSQNLPGSYDIAFSNYSLTQDTIQNFTLPVREVSVHIQDANNNPVSGVALTATSSGISNLSVDGLTANGNDGYGTSTGAVPTTDANGNATLWLFPSTYTITATPPSGSSYILTTDSNVSVTSDTSETITLQQPVTFSGYIYDESGNPAKDQTVYISTPSSTIDTTTTNSSGYYSTSVAPGTYKVDISNSSDYNDLSQNLPGSYDIAFSNYSLTQDTIQNFTLPVREVSVHIQDANNNPVSGVALTATSSGISNLSVDGLTANGNDGYGTSTGAVPTTDANGNATLWLFPSTYTITATPPSGSSYDTFAENGITVTADQNEVFSLQYSHNAPTTTASLSPSANGAGVYADPVTVTLSATAATGYSIANTYYTIDGGAQQTYTTPFTVSGTGSHTITYWSADNSGVQEASNTTTFTIQLLPSAPTNLTAPTPTNLYPSLSWTASTGATSYNIYRNGTVIGNTTDTTYTDSSLYTATSGSTDGTYSYTITAVNAIGESAQSSPASVVYDTTPPIVTITGAVNGETYAANNTPTPVCTTTDSLSGVATNATVSVSNTGNSYTATCSGASDNAGNITPSVSETYTVLPANYTLVNLTNSNGTGLSGAKVTIENSASQITTLYTDSFGTTYLNTTPGTYKVTVYYANGYESEYITVTANGPNNISLTTIPVTVTINDPSSGDIANASVAQAGNTGDFGAKQPVNNQGQIVFQVLPGTSYFTAYDANGYEEQSLSVSQTNNTVTFNTYTAQVTVDKNGNPLTTAQVSQAGNSGDYGSKQNVNSNGQITFNVLPGTNYFIAWDGSNYTKQTLNVTANTSTTMSVN